MLKGEGTYLLKWAFGDFVFITLVVQQLLLREPMSSTKVKVTEDLSAVQVGSTECSF